MTLLQLPLKTTAHAPTARALTAYMSDARPATWAGVQAKRLPLARRIAAIGIRAARPTELLALFSGTLGLPVTATGSIALGNMRLEIAGGGVPGTAEAARGHVLSLEPCGGSLAEAAKALRIRELPHSAPLSFARGARIYLGGLLDDTVWARSLFFLSRIAGIGGTPQSTGTSGPAFHQLLDRSFPDGAVCLTEYAAHEGGAAYAAARLGDGGPLGVEYVEELRVGVPDVVGAAHQWGRLLEPLAPQDRGYWRIGDGPALRLVSCKRAGVQLLVLGVRSLATARAYLAAHGLLGFHTEDELTLRLPQAPDLHIRLMER